MTWTRTRFSRWRRCFGESPGRARRKSAICSAGCRRKKSGQRSRPANCRPCISAFAAASAASSRFARPMPTPTWIGCSRRRLPRRVRRYAGRRWTRYREPRRLTSRTNVTRRKATEVRDETFARLLRNRVLAGRRADRPPARRRGVSGDSPTHVQAFHLLQFVWRWRDVFDQPSRLLVRDPDVAAMATVVVNARVFARGRQLPAQFTVAPWALRDRGHGWGTVIIRPDRLARY